MALVLFPILALLGVVMRLSQADLLPDLPPGTLLGVVLLIACTLVGKLGVGWYFLYPLPFHPGGTWPQWSIAALLLYLGVMGWAIGGVAAVIDSTVSVNFRFHNTLWVPAHFHSYYLMGVVLMILGFAYHFCQESARLPERPGLARPIVALLDLGGYGFLLAFYLGGAASVPRRFATYPAEVARGITYARVTLAFISMLLAGALLYIWETGRRCLRALSAERPGVGRSDAAAPGGSAARRGPLPSEAGPRPSRTRCAGRRVPALGGVGRAADPPGSGLHTVRRGLPPLLSSLSSAEASVGGSGTDYRTFVLSFDPRDTEEDMAALARRLGLAARPDWTFGVSSGAAVERLARTVGFWFRWDEPTAQFDHPALLVAVDRGRVVRLMVGGTAEPVRLLEVVRELRGGFVAACPRPGRVLFRCFQYDPRTGRFALGWGFRLLAVPATLTLLGTAALFVAARRGRPTWR